MSGMDIEKFVEAPGRAEQVKEVRKKIDALGIEYLYLQFVSVTGKIMGKGIPADHWESEAKKGFQLVYGSTVTLFTDCEGSYLGYGPEAAGLVGIPDTDDPQMPGKTGLKAIGGVVQHLQALTLRHLRSPARSRIDRSFPLQSPGRDWQSHASTYLHADLRHPSSGPS